jgi:hypothetical protein
VSDAFKDDQICINDVLVTQKMTQCILNSDKLELVNQRIKDLRKQVSCLTQC